MYIVKLNNDTGELYKAYTDYAFTTTTELAEATKFKSLEEATSILQLQGIKNLYDNPTVERIKK